MFRSRAGTFHGFGYRHRGPLFGNDRFHSRSEITALTKQIYSKSEKEVQPISVAYCFNIDENCKYQMSAITNSKRKGTTR